MTAWKARDPLIRLQERMVAARVASDRIEQIKAAVEQEIEDAVMAMIGKVQAYVPGYRLKQALQFERFGSNNPVQIPGVGTLEGIKTSVFLEVEGAAHYLPAYAGNLDIMTSAALSTGEKIAHRKVQERAA